MDQVNTITAVGRLSKHERNYFIFNATRVPNAPLTDWRKGTDGACQRARLLARSLRRLREQTPRQSPIVAHRVATESSSSVWFGNAANHELFAGFARLRVGRRLLDFHLPGGYP